MLQDTEEKKGDTQTHTQSSQERTHWCTRLMIGQVRWGQCALLCADKQTWALTLAHLNLDLMFISADWDQSNAWWWKQQQGTKMHFWWSLLSFFYFVCFLTTKPAIPLVSATCEHTVQLYTSHACKDIGCVTVQGDGGVLIYKVCVRVCTCVHKSTHTQIMRPRTCYNCCSRLPACETWDKLEEGVGSSNLWLIVKSVSWYIWLKYRPIG